MPGSQWRELELKVRQFDSLLHAPAALDAAPNVNALWARLMVEELCRCGVTTFAIAPGVLPHGGMDVVSRTCICLGAQDNCTPVNFMFT